ncbi:MAG: ABC transporter substrate-binding protein [Treponema sp.]|nr:ABC transporter substrate-binding protein [Treponema sp.]
MKKILIGMSMLAALALTGCTKKTDAKVLKIGVIQLVEHPALDSSYKGFVDGLAEAGFVDGKNIVIDYQNAQGEQANCVTIANKLVNDKDDLILAIATPAAQAVANLTTEIPILVTAVTDPQSANLVKSNEKPDTNVSGTSDLTPVNAQISLLKKIVPNAKTVGLMYCSSEQNSVFQIEIAKKSCAENGLEFVEGSVSNSNEIQQVTQSLVGKVDAIYIPTDNMLAAGMATVAMVANEAKLPVIVGEGGMVASGGLCTYGINYYELGKQTATQAVDILKNGANPKDMPIQYLEKCDFTKNENTEKALGITLPDNL